MSPELRRLLWPWLLLPLTALDWWIAWSHLPERVVMKLGADGHPMSWATREQAMTVDLGLMGGVLVFATVLAIVTTLLQPDRAKRISIGAAACSTLVGVVLNGVLWIYQVQ